MTFLSVDPNLASVVQGVILIGVVMVGSLVQLRRRSADEQQPAAAAPRSRGSTLAAGARLFRDRPIVPLLVLLVILV